MADERRISRREALGALGMMGTLGALGLPAAPAVAHARPAPSTEPGGAVFGNLSRTIEWVGSEVRPRLSFLDPRWKSLAEWKRVARPAFRERLGFAPPSTARCETIS
ncbi:MAG TPA: twin-arginine translocation signal domain-containing protein, partial [Longimicrobium sp.]